MRMSDTDTPAKHQTQRLARAGSGTELTDPETAFARDLRPAPGRLPLRCCCGRSISLCAACR